MKLYVLTMLHVLSRPFDECSWPGHCIGSICSTENDCSDILICNNSICANSECSWPGHCIGSICSTENDCSDILICNNGLCGKRKCLVSNTTTQTIQTTLFTQQTIQTTLFTQQTTQTTLFTQQTTQQTTQTTQIIQTTPTTESGSELNPLDLCDISSKPEDQECDNGQNTQECEDRLLIFCLSQ
jgi:hypothetical protein